MAWIKRHLSLFLIALSFWCLLNESLQPLIILSGLFLSFITVLAINYLNRRNQLRYHLLPSTLLRYLGYLIYHMLSAALSTGYAILTHQINPTFIKVDSRLRSPWLQSLVGNAITLTPGTVTIDITNQTFTILWLYPNPLLEKESDFYDALLKQLDRIFEKEDYRHA